MAHSNVWQQNQLQTTNPDNFDYASLTSQTQDYGAGQSVMDAQAKQRAEAQAKARRLQQTQQQAMEESVSGPSSASGSAGADISAGGGGGGAGGPAADPSITALPESLQSMGGGGFLQPSGEGEQQPGTLGTQSGALRPLGRRMLPQMSGALASLGRRIY